MLAGGLKATGNTLQTSTVVIQLTLEVHIPALSKQEQE